MEPPHRANPSPKPPISGRVCVRRGLAAVLLACCALSACEDSTHLTVAVEALKSREKKIVAREKASVDHEQRLAERERELAESAVAIEKQRTELEELRQTLQEEIARTKRQQDALLERERRGPPPAVSAERIIIIDPRTDEVLLEKNADRKGPVASTQKLLTALLVVEGGNLDLPVTIAKEDSQCAPVKIGMSEGEQYSRRQLLTALMVKSFNDIARAIARDHAGSIEGFVKKMNERARQLGMNSSRFANPNGLPADDQYSTARDMAKIAKIADATREIRSMVSTKSFAFKRPGGRFDILENTNRVLRNCSFCDGMKTGYTDAAGYCLVCSGERDGKRRIVVVLNGTRDDIWKDSEALLEWSLKS